MNSTVPKPHFTTKNNCLKPLVLYPDQAYIPIKFSFFECLDHRISDYQPPERKDLACVISGCNSVFSIELAENRNKYQ